MICGTSAIDLNSARKPRFARPRGHRRHPRREVGGRLDLGGAPIGVPGAFEVAARLEQLAGLDERHGVGAVEFDGAAETVERRVRIALFALEQAELAVKKRAVRRRLQRPLVRLAGLGQPPRGRRRPGRLDHVLQAAEAQHVHAAAHIDERRVGGQRSLEGGEGVDVALQRQQRLTAADECRHICRRGTQRGIEAAKRTVLIAPRQRHVSRPHLGRIQPGSLLQGRRELPFRVARIVVLQVAPAPIDLRRGVRVGIGRAAAPDT